MRAKEFTINGKSYRMDATIRALIKENNVTSADIEKEYNLLKSITPLYQVRKEHAAYSAAMRKMGK